MSQHLVLLGDSILDNAAYVPGSPAVIDQIRAGLPRRWMVTLLAVDGSVINGVHRQLERLPEDASHLVLSMGGNDVLSEIGSLQEPVRTVGEGLRFLADLRERFDTEYRLLIQKVTKLGLPTVVCTVYNPCSADALLQQEAVSAICLFNDAIIGIAREFKLPAIDLRAICTEIADFANEIEPSSIGGAKIAWAICDVVLNHDFAKTQAVLYP